MSSGRKDVAIIGAGNQGALLYDCLAGNETWRPWAFVDDGKAGGSLQGLPILGTDRVDLLRGQPAFLARGFPEDRRALAQSLAPLDIDWQTYVDHRSVVGSGAELGRGTVVLSFAMVASGVSVGPFCYLSAHSRIGTGARIGAFSSVMAGATVGDSRIGAGCILGINSICIDGATLGDRVRVAPNVLVRQSAPDDALIAGQPARIFKRRS